VLKIRLPLGPQASFGTLLHDLFRDYYQSRQHGEPYSLEQLQQRLADRWTTRGYETAERAELARQRAETTLKYFYEREERAKRTLRASEESFSLVVEGAKLRVKGRIDASFETPEGIEIRDFKTGRARDAEKLSERAKNKSLQLRTYAVAIQEMTGEVPARVVLDYVVTGTEGVAVLSPRILANHRDKLTEIADRIRKHEFMPKKDLYHTCVAYRYWGEAEADEISEE
jgi:ATP-dependent exoDNAse (exonuclease V) beta subunit